MKCIAITIAGVCCALMLGCRSEPEPFRARTVSSGIKGIQVRPVKPLTWQFTVPDDCDTQKMAAEIREAVGRGSVPVGTIVLADGTLSVHGAEAYQRVRPLLEARGMIAERRRIRIEARSLMMTTTFLARMGNRFEWQLMASRPRAGEVIQVCMVADRTLERFLRAVQESPEAQSLTMPSLTLAEGETGTIRGLGGKDILWDYDILPKGSSTDFSPLMMSVLTGLGCEVTAQFKGRNRLLLDLRFTQYALRDPEPKPEPPIVSGIVPISIPVHTGWPAAPTRAGQVVIEDRSHQVALPVEVPAVAERVLGHVLLDVADRQTIATRKPGIKLDMPLAEHQRKRGQGEPKVEHILLLRAEIVNPGD